MPSRAAVFARQPALLAEYGAVRTLIAAGGIQALVRYLRSPNPRLVPRLLKDFGAQLGPGTTFRGALLLDGVEGDEHSTSDLTHLSMGANCFVGESVYFDLSDRIRVGDDAIISARASILTHQDCGRSEELARAFPRKHAPTSVEAGAWIGFGATLLCGVTVAEQAVVGAHALVRTNVERRTLCAGVPAIFIRQLDPKNEPSPSELPPTLTIEPLQPFMQGRG